MAIGQKLFNIGEKAIITGLFLQLASFGAFIAVAVTFQKRINRMPTFRVIESGVRRQRYLITLYVTGGIIWVRSLFRVIEYLQGNDGVLMKTEVFLYIFDATLIFIATAWMNRFHPSEVTLLLRGQTPREKRWRIRHCEIVQIPFNP